MPKRSKDEKPLFGYNSRLLALSNQLDRLKDDQEAKRMALMDYLQESTHKFQLEEHSSSNDESGDEGDEDHDTGKAGGDHANAYVLAQRHGLAQAFDDWLLKRTLRMAKPPLEFVPCANARPDDDWHCENAGKLTCGQCKLLSYCSKDCQRSHWRYHKPSCKDPIRASEWQPGWVRESRRPDFGMDGPRIWGNIPAMDTLNLAKNELAESATPPSNLAVAYIGSADFRNVLLTINNLPPTFSGTVTILLNAPPTPATERDPLAPRSINFVRTMLTLLLLSLISDEAQATEVATHFLASAFGQRQHLFAYQRAVKEVVDAVRVFTGESRWGLEHAEGADGGKEDETKEKEKEEEGGERSIEGEIQEREYPFFLGLGKDLTGRGNGKEGMKCLISEQTYSLLQAYLRSDLLSQNADNSYKQARFGPSEDDRHERLYCRLEPPHRRAYIVFRIFGHTYPINCAKGFDSPNMCLFSPEGEWLQDDLAYPLDEWNMEDVIAKGKAHGCPPADLFGCLYFYLSSQLRTFLSHLRNPDVTLSFKFFQRDPHVLAKEIREGKYEFLGIPGDIVFDRVDFGDVADREDSQYADIGDGRGMAGVLEDWGPLLNRNNPSATILGYSANWVSKQQKSQPSPVDMQAITLQLLSKGRLDSQKMHPDLIPVWFKYFVALYDNSPAFEEYLTRQGLDEAATKAGLKRKKKHTVVPHRIGGQIGDTPNSLPHFPTDESWYWKVQVCQALLSEQFVEFGIA
ncbi:hypothetical protein CVT26_004742 [Gymnopilus dilepis]|uniref:MYND-type domain-containing protein n=1 Tax=Gymnopilus dilepis TaxID=231916 RepID=A0A409XZA4_9AGAR|nr:hypothetical protein CVT26_004742 [Gymnopilus dilepis]